MSLFSKNWYRVEKLKPRIKPQVEISPQDRRGEPCYAFRDPISGTIQLYSQQAYTVIGLMDGERTLNDIWLLTGDLLADEMPTQEDVIAMISSLYQVDMLYLNVPANAADLFKRRDEKHEKKLLQKVYSPVSVQIPLFDPTRLLDFLCPILDKLIGRKALVIYAVCVIYGIVTAAQNFEALTSNASDRILAADNLFLLWVLYPLIKIIHELGHAYAVRRYGGQVHEVGIMFLVFFPMPYVNASESAAFSSKNQRIIVAAAGLIVELFIAAIAVVLWSMASDGLIKSILYNIAFMAGISTLLFNGNPLLKFDAYYMLSDYLEIPGLAKKSVSYWGYLVKKYIFGFREIEDPSIDPRERWWLFFYNLFAFIYRIFISVAIFLFIASHYFVVGMILGIWTLISSWVVPLVKTLAKPFKQQEFVLQGRNPKWVMAVLAGLLFVVLFVLPMPYSYTTSGVAWTSESERLYAGESGFVEQINIPKTALVEKGHILIELANYQLQDRAAEITAQLAEAQARVRSTYSDRSKTSLAGAELQRFADEQQDVEQSLREAVVRADTSGQLVLMEPALLVDRFLQRGEVIGYVMDPSQPLTVRVVLPEAKAEQVLNSIVDVSVRAASDRARVIAAELRTVVPRVSKQIPSAVLATVGGGDIVLDPSAQSELQAVENYVVVDVQVPSRNLKFVSERFYVRFRLQPEPIIWRWYREIRQVFIEQFDV